MMDFLLGETSRDGLSIYRMHHLYAVLLEALADRQYCTPNELFPRISPYINHEIKWNATSQDIGEAAKYLIFIGMLEANNESALRITDIGLVSL